MTRGWKGEPQRHALASRGIKTVKKFDVKDVEGSILDKGITEFEKRRLRNHDMEDSYEDDILYQEQEAIESILSFLGTKYLGYVEMDYPNSPFKMKVPVFRVPYRFQDFKDMILKEGNTEPFQSEGMNYIFVDKENEPVAMVNLETWTKFCVPPDLSNEEKEEYVDENVDKTTKILLNRTPEDWESEQNFYDMDDITYGQYAFVSWNPDKVGDIK